MSTPPYPNDSLRWVAADVRVPPSAVLAGELPDALREALPELPVASSVPGISFNVSVGGAPPAGLGPQVILHRLTTRERLLGLTLGRDGITLETTSYGGWTAFREVLDTVLASVEQCCRPDGVLRIGLRYVHELRLPQPPRTVGGWEGWVNPRLLAPFGLDPADEPSQGQVVLQYGLPPGYVTVMRAGPLPRGRVVQSDGQHLRQPSETPDDAFFFLDTDASWADPDGGVPEFSAPEIVRVFGELHEPCRRLVEEAIEDRFRNEILLQPGNDGVEATE